MFLFFLAIKETKQHPHDPSKYLPVPRFIVGKSVLKTRKLLDGYMLVLTWISGCVRIDRILLTYRSDPFYDDVSHF